MTPTGFLQGRKVNGRPADILSFGTDRFFSLLMITRRRLLRLQKY